MSTKEIHLYGHLAKQYGKVHHYNVSNPLEVFSALRANYPELNKEFRTKGFSDYRILVGTDEVIESDLKRPVGRKEIIRIIPRMEGGVEGIGMIIFKAIISSLISMAISAILYSGPKNNADDNPNKEKQDKNRASYVFNGAVNTSVQGNPISVGYGRLMVGSQVIYASLTAKGQ